MASKNAAWRGFRSAKSVIPIRNGSANWRTERTELIDSFKTVLPHHYFCIEPGGAFNPLRTSAHTPSMPTPPMLYAISLPAHQYKVQNVRGPSALPSCPDRVLVRSSLHGFDYPLTPTPMIPQFPAPLALRSLKTTQTVQARYDRRGRHS